MANGPKLHGRVGVSMNEMSVRLANERNPGTSNEYGVGVDESNGTVWAHDDGDTQVTEVPALVFGVYCNANMTGAGTTLRNGTTASGDALVVLPALSQGDYIQLPGVKFNNGIFIEDSSTGGNITVFWRPQ